MEEKDLQAIAAIATQVENFGKILGEKVDSAEIEYIKTMIEDLKKSIDTATSDNISAQIKSINEANDKLYNQVVKMQEEIAEAKEKEAGAKTTAEIVSKSEIESFVKGIFPEGKNSKKSRNYEGTIEVKAAETFGYNSFTTGTDVSAYTGRVVDPVLYQKRRKTNIILDYFDIRTIDVPTLIYLRKIEEGVAPDPANGGGAAWIACGQQKPKRSFRLTTGEANAKKVAIFAEIDDCLIQDVPSFERWIREDLFDEIREATNNGLLNGDPDVNPLQPTGLKKNAVLFSATPAFASDVENATYIDAIFAIAARFAVNKESARVIFVTNDIFYRIHNLKSTDGRYQNNNLVYTNQLGQLFIAGIEIVPVDAEDVPETHFLAIGADLGFKIYAYGMLVIESGLNGENFREDKTSIRGWQRFLTFIPEERENSVMYDTWVNVLTAIEKN